MGHKFKQLKIWILAKEIAIDIYKATKDFPNEEKFGLANQMRRCSISVASNIAEGSGRNSENEFKQFLGISRGSLYELETQIIISSEVGLFPTELYENIMLKIENLNKMLFTFKKNLNTNKSNL